MKCPLLHIFSCAMLLFSAWACSPSPVPAGADSHWPPLQKSTPAEMAHQDTARQFYRAARAMEQQGDLDSARTLLRQAMELCDTTRYEYDYRRIRLVSERLNDVAPIIRYSHLIGDERYFRSVGDLEMQANVAQQLGNIFIATLRFEDALTQLLRCDSLLAVARLSNYRLKNRINTAMAYNHTGDSARADSTLRPLLSDPSIAQEPAVLNTVLRNMHVITGNRRYLLQAMRLLGDSTCSSETALTYAAILSEDYHNAGMTDSADLYARAAYAHIDRLHDYNTRAMALRAYGRSLRRQAKSDSLVMVQDAFITTLDSLQLYRRTLELGRLENERGIMRIREATEANRRQQRYRYLALIGILLVAAGTTLVVLMRRNAHQKLRHLEFQLQTERDRRRMLALTMKMEEKEGFISSLRKEIAAINETKPSRETDRLEAIIKANESESITREHFFEAFERLNPSFIPRLKAQCPTLTESLLQLACLIVAGVDNRHIADILNIRPSSVNQARWRLRSKLQLDKEASLEEALRGLLS